MLSNSAWQPSGVGLLLAGMALLAGIGWLIRRERRLAGELHAARADARASARLLDGWLWRSDLQHRLIEMRPPDDAPALAWTRAAQARGQALEALFEAEEGAALRALLQAQAPVVDMPVHCAITQPTTHDEVGHLRLRALLRTDALGRFAGYQGTLRAIEPPATAPALAATLAEKAGDDSDSFAYTVSHDLRAPIRVIEGFAKILKEDYGRQLDRVGNDHLDRVLGAAARMHHMIDALLALSRLTTQPVERQSVNLTQLAHYVADDLRRQAPERRVTLHVQSDLQAHGDPTLLRVMLENLLGNAWKYTARCTEAHIWFDQATRQGPHGSELVFTLRDNGAGFDMRFADRLFGVFQRLHSASDFQGTGVGLASVRRIVRRHGGEIWAEAEVDRGARFHFTLAPVDSPGSP